MDVSHGAGMVSRRTGGSECRVEGPARNCEAAHSAATATLNHTLAPGMAHPHRRPEATEKYSFFLLGQFRI